MKQYILSPWGCSVLCSRCRHRVGAKEEIGNYQILITCSRDECTHFKEVKS